VLVALLGSRPLWLPAVLALVIFPVAAAAASGGAERRGEGSIAALMVTALAGGLLAALAARLAFDATDWFNAGAVDCGGASDSTQHSILTAASVVFAGASLAMIASLLIVARGAGRGDERTGSPPLALYPVAVAASGLALIASSYATNC
jgi:hypothetical protein